MPSFVKYVQQDQRTNGNGRGNLSFARAHIDGAPFRGKTHPMLRDEEWDEYSETVKDTYSDIFDIGDPDKKARLDAILDAAGNGWYNIIRWNEKWTVKEGVDTMLVFVVWQERFKELSSHRLPVSLLPAEGPHARTQLT